MAKVTSCFIRYVCLLDDLYASFLNKSSLDAFSVQSMYAVCKLGEVVGAVGDACTRSLLLKVEI